MSLGPDELELFSDLGPATRELSLRFRDCPEPSLLLAAEAGVLPVEVSARISRHLEACCLCKLMALDLAEVDAAPIAEPDRVRMWNQIQSGIPLERVSSRRVLFSGAWWKAFLRPIPIGVTAMAVLLIGMSVLVGVNFFRGARGPQHQAVSSSGPGPGGEQAVSQPSPEPATPSVPASVAFRLEKAPVRLTAAAAMIWRGDAGAENAQAKELEKALAPYRADDYAGAAKRLESVATKYPRLPEARFYLGVCQLFLNQNSEAVASLKTAASLAAKPMAGDVAWYLALAYQRNGQDSEARPLLQRLCQAGGKNATKACAALAELSPPR